jgi:hypothetical protein
MAKVKKSILQLPTPFKGRHLQADMTPAEMVTHQVSTSPFGHLMIWLTL